ncbi:MAG: hypothetical protein JKX85_02015 [Phycisphaeraceae bacterium]|nr:hypothetical protein [Phycisphaeraceae bacterium]
MIYVQHINISQIKPALGRTMILCLMCIVVCVGITGCSPYQLRGKVVMGNQSVLASVSAQDSRLSADPIENATVELTLDPSSISPKQLGQVVTDIHGNFVLDIEAMGAGSFQEYDLGILVTAKNHKNVWQTIKLPSRKKQLLVIMTTGNAGPKPPRDILKESLQLKDRFMGQ